MATSRSRVMFVCRCKEGSGLYNLFRNRPQRIALHGGSWSGFDKVIHGIPFESLFGLRLAPGEGPVAVRMISEKRYQEMLASERELQALRASRR